MKCPHCQAENREGRKFCSKCGASIAGRKKQTSKNTSIKVVCSACGRSISNKEMNSSLLSFKNRLGEKAKYVPNVMEGLAMMCKRCGVWICIHCAEKAAVSSGAGMIQHANCGGFFESP